MSDKQKLEFDHKTGGWNGQRISVTIHADYGRWTEARTLRKDIKDILKGDAEVVRDD